MPVPADKSYFAAVRPHEFVTDREAKPGPRRFRSEKGVENSARDRWIDSASGIVEFHADLLSFC
jgi:hypothetical protein